MQCDSAALHSKHQQDLPVVAESKLAKHFCGILGGALHGSHTRRLLTAIVL